MNGVNYYAISGVQCTKQEFEAAGGSDCCAFTVWDTQAYTDALALAYASMCGAEPSE